MGMTEHLVLNSDLRNTGLKAVMYRVNHYKGVRRKPLAYLLDNKTTPQPSKCSTGKGLPATLAFNYSKAESGLA